MKKVFVADDWTGSGAGAGAVVGAETAGKGGAVYVGMLKYGVTSVGGAGAASAIAALGGANGLPYVVCGGLAAAVCCPSSGGSLRSLSIVLT